MSYLQKLKYVLVLELLLLYGSHSADYARGQQQL